MRNAVQRRIVTSRSLVLQRFTSHFSVEKLRSNMKRTFTAHRHFFCRHFFFKQLCDKNVASFCVNILCMSIFFCEQWIFIFMYLFEYLLLWVSSSVSVAVIAEIDDWGESDWEERWREERRGKEEGGGCQRYELKTRTLSFRMSEKRGFQLMCVALCFRADSMPHRCYMKFVVLQIRCGWCYAMNSMCHSMPCLACVRSVCALFFRIPSDFSISVFLCCLSSRRVKFLGYVVILMELQGICFCCLRVAFDESLVVIFDGAARNIFLFIWSCAYFSNWSASVLALERILASNRLRKIAAAGTAN